MKIPPKGSKCSDLAMAAGSDLAVGNVVSQARERAGVSHPTSHEGLSIEWYENCIPSFVEAALEERYGSLFSSLVALRAYGSLANVSVFVAKRGGELAVLWLYRREGKSIRVLNEGIRIAAEEIDCFATHIFASCSDLAYITFNAVEMNGIGLPWPLQRLTCTDDSVLALPGSFDDYLASLGKATRKNMRRYTVRLKECFPSLAWHVSERERIDERHVRDVIALNRARMTRKGKQWGVTTEDERAILDMARQRGMLVLATVDGKTCAGAVLLRIGPNYFSFIRAHDPEFDDFRLGLCCAGVMISECIARGGKELHFMWGREPHKAMLLGVEKKLDRVVLYRSVWHLLANPRVAAGNACTSAIRHARLWLQDRMKRDGDPVGMIAVAVRQAVRRLRGRHAASDADDSA